MPQLYQDIWVKGQVQSHGQRECAERYELIKRFCAQYTRPFTVLDIGAADGYFAVRLTEDFPECTVVAVEPRIRIQEVLSLNDAQRVLWLEKKLSVADIHRLAEVEHFDVTLALSVIHWLDQPPTWSIGALQELGDHLILESPVEPNATGQKIVEAIELPPDGTLLGYGKSHLDPNAKRPIHLFSRRKKKLAKSYWGGHESRNIGINSHFDVKTYVRGDTKRAWYRGINLQTFLALNGRYPSRERIAEQVSDRWYSVWGPTNPHGDLEPWNVILQGDDAILIDPKPGGPRASEDGAYHARLISIIRGPK